MYGKIFDSIYSGTLVANWEALVTFQQFIVLADDAGVVDMTPHVIAARTGIPLDIIEKGISILEAPDKYSRSTENEGRRIERLDDHRPWGWQITNYLKYRQLASWEDKKAADRNRIAAKREAEKSRKNNDVASCSKESQAVESVADVAHTDKDKDKDKENKHTSVSPPSGNRKSDIPPCPHDEIIALWNQTIPELPQVQVTRWHQNKTRKRKLEARWREDKQHQTLEFWQEVFNVIRQDDFWMGRTGWTKATFDWFLEPRNFQKIYDKADLLTRGASSDS